MVCRKTPVKTIPSKKPNPKKDKTQKHDDLAAAAKDSWAHVSKAEGLAESEDGAVNLKTLRW